MEAPTFVAANEDYNIYAFDMRKLQRPTNVHMDHVSAVTCVDFAPTGREFVSGSYDKTVRIFPVDKGRSREVYHTKRMQRLTCVAWSRDNRYILSGILINIMYDIRRKKFRQIDLISRIFWHVC